jgi:hypothetical protein
MRGNSNFRVLETVQNKGFCKVGNGLLLMVLLEREGERGRKREKQIEEARREGDWERDWGEGNR